MIDHMVHNTINTGQKSHLPKRFVLISKRVSGLEEAMRIRSNSLGSTTVTEHHNSPKVSAHHGPSCLILIRNARERELRTSTTAKRRPPLRRGKVSQRLPVPDHIPKPPYLGSNLLPELSSEHQIHDSEGIARMRAACELAARVLDYAGTLIRPSVTTNEIDKAVHQMIIDAGAYPSPLGYGGFPKSVCTSVNECMCHGIPDSRQLQVVCFHRLELLI
ncbi:hypothetical protein TEA_005716 [Camellia sinensis var. sinensis]|uniref:Peptidase M24 domain-containing protein n=1 Tax=Camellia sinensis var. sinensis TaxID=542762 RepID=A0A4S4D6D5_CAMSN|nr:hypothetical protein TEA_005716 [Camellia sinensis var. sinensis]